MRFKIYVSLKEDINLSSIWIQSAELKERKLVQLKNTVKKKSIWVDAHAIDKNFLSNYNEGPRDKIDPKDKVIVINEWYRGKLDIEKGSSYELTITPSCNSLKILRQVQAALDHPDSSVRLSAILGIFSLLLGIIGLVLGFISLF